MAVRPATLDDYKAKMWELSPAPSFIFRKGDRVIVAVNQAALKALGMTAEKILGASVDTVLSTAAVSAEVEDDSGYTTRWLGALAPAHRPFTDRAVYSRSSSIESPAAGSGRSSITLQRMQHAMAGPLTRLRSSVDAEERVPEGMKSALDELTVNYEALTLAFQMEKGELSIVPTRAELYKKLAEFGLTSDIAISLEIDESLKKRLLTLDWSKVGFIIKHLTRNAIDHSPIGKKVTVKIAIDASCKLQFTVIDQGRGMEARFLKSLLEGTLEGSAIAFGSSGFKLDVCKRLTAAMGGTLDSTSAVDKGTTFTCSFPLSRGDMGSVVSALTTDDSTILISGGRPPRAPIAIRLPPVLPLEPRAGSAAATAVSDHPFAVSSPRSDDLTPVRTPLFVGPPSSGAAARHLSIATPQTFGAGSGSEITIVTDGTSLIKERRGWVDPAIVMAVRDQYAKDIKTAEKMGFLRVASQLKEMPKVVMQILSVEEPVLIVDDEPSSRSLLVRFFKKLGFSNIHTAENGQIAVDKVKAGVTVVEGAGAGAKAERKEFVFILMDEQMPTKTGSDAARDIKVWEREQIMTEGGIVRYCPIVAASSNTSAADYAKYQDSGMEEELFPKPFNIRLLRSILEKYFYDMPEEGVSPHAAGSAASAGSSAAAAGAGSA